MKLLKKNFAVKTERLSNSTEKTTGFGEKRPKNTTELLKRDKEKIRTTK